MWRVDAVDASGNACCDPQWTDNAGTFVLQRPAVACRVRANLRDADWSQPDVEVQAAVDQTEVLLLVADARVGSVVGRLLDGRGAPLADADVFLVRPGWDNPRQPVHAS